MINGWVPTQSECWRNANKEVLHTPKNFRIGASPPDAVSVILRTPPFDGFYPFSRDTVNIIYAPPTKKKFKIFMGSSLSLRVFGLLSSSLLLFPQRFGQYVLRPSSGVCCLNFREKALRFLSLRVFGLLSSSLLLFPQRFGRYVLRPSSGVY